MWHPLVGAMRAPSPGSSPASPSHVDGPGAVTSHPDGNPGLLNWRGSRCELLDDVVPSMVVDRLT